MKTDNMPTDRVGMEISALFIGLILCLSLYELSSSLALNGSGDGLRQRAGLAEERTVTGLSSEASPVKCKFQGTARQPAFSMDGDFVIGGVFSTQYYKNTVRHNYTTMPEPQSCKGRLVRGRNETREKRM